MRFFRQALIGLTLLTLSLGILAYAGSLIKDALTERFAQEARAPQPRERTFAVNVVTAEPKSITPQLEAFGEIKSRRTLDLRLAIGGQGPDRFNTSNPITRYLSLCRFSY